MHNTLTKTWRQAKLQIAASKLMKNDVLDHHGSYNIYGDFRKSNCEHKLKAAR